MLLHWRNWFVGWLFVVGILIVVDEVESHNMEINYDKHDDPLKMTSGEVRLRDIQNKFFDIMGNSSSELHSLTQLMGLLHSDSGKEMGKLFIEGLTLGVQQKDSGQILGQFWKQLQGRLSPQLQESMTDYQDFFKGMDVSTLPLIWEQLFQKDELGNSLAGLPLGQLVDMVQPTAAKYGIDMKALMNSFMGQGEYNIRDLILSALNNADFTSLMNQIINTTTNAVQTSDTDRNPGHKNQDGDVHKKGKTEKALRLFRPLIASLLKENEIDLDADAVLEVLSPIFKSDIITQAAPWISMLTGQGDTGGIGPLIANLMGGGQEGLNSQQMIGLLGSLGGLMTNSGKNQMDMSSMLSLASMFMNKPSKKKANKNKSNQKPKKQKDDLDLGALMNMAGQLMGKNINMDSILDMATKGLKSGGEKKKVNDPPSKVSAKKSQTTKQGTTAPKVPNKDTKTTTAPKVPNKDTKTTTAPKVPNKDTKTKPEKSYKTGKKSNNLIDIIEPILLSMKTDKKCNAKIKDAIEFGKVMLKNKISKLGDLSKILPFLISSVTSGDTLKKNGLNIDALTTSFTQAFAHADWSEFLVSLENRDFREMLIHNIASNAAELVILLATEETQNKIYDTVVPRIQNFMASYGLAGVTLENFPERLAPMLGLLGRGWNLPFNPTTRLVPLKGYLKGLKSWTLTGLEEVRSLTPKEVEERVIDVLKNDVCDGVLKVVRVTRTTSDPHCLPQRLCVVNSGLQPDSLKEAITRVVSLVTASGPVLQTPDPNLLYQTIQAISGTQENCKVAFPGDCISSGQEKEGEAGSDEEESLSMNLLYEHQEL